MSNQLYVKLKRYIKENKKAFIMLMLLYILFTYPLPYSIYTPGGLIDIKDKVTIDNETKEGSFYFTYVNEIKATLPTFFLSYVVSDWDLIHHKKETTQEETKEDSDYREQMFLNDSIQNATLFVYHKLQKEVKIIDERFFVVYVDPLAVTDVKIKDEILSIETQKVKDINDFMDYVNTQNYGAIIGLQVKTKDHLITTKKVKVLNYKNNKITGLYILPKINYDLSPKIEYHFLKNESGPSGGLMLALTIYNKLVTEDITKGKKIVGTGTIDINGKVGEISGVEYKLKGAVKKKADIFLVPQGNNYNKAMALKEKYHYNITIVGILTFDDALNYLKMM